MERIYFLEAVMSHMQAENRWSSTGPVGVVVNLLSKILDFLFDKFRNLPPPARIAAYFIFLGFFCATAWRLVAGQYLVRGVIWNGEEHAQACEIRLRGDYFSTNSKGMYYAVVSPMQYYRFAVADEIELQVMCRQPDGYLRRVKGPFKVTLSLWDDEFSEIDLRVPSTKASFSFSLIKSAYAQQAPVPAPRTSTPPAPSPSESSFPSRGDRLVVERITLGTAARKMREVEFELELGSKEIPLLLRGSEAGDLPMKSAVTFGERYYFDVPQGHEGQRVSVEMEAPGLFGREEEFNFAVPAQYNTPVTVRGSKGSILVLRLAPRTPVPF